MRVLLKCLAGWLLFLPIFSSAQYFGQNKVQYDDLKFRILQTPHFNIYYYDDDSAVIKDVAQMAEIWYDRLSKIFNHEFHYRNPLIVYASPEHFAQTDVIPGIIGEGIGGVTEGSRNRVIIPLTGSWSDNNHVLGHELVHAFQYSILGSTDSLSIRSSLNMPLWFIEGMAEYLSLDSYDPNTAMWVRDAVVYDYFPTLKKMTNDYQYFPYRWGQAFWSYVTGIYGDDVIPKLYYQTALYGYEIGIRNVLGLKPDSLSVLWKESAQLAYQPYLEADVNNYSKGVRIFEDKKFLDEQDFAPSISPNGKYIVFLSSRNVFTLDVFLADAKSRKIIRKLKTEREDAHNNAFRLVESAATWSPDSKKLAIVSYEGGNHYLKIFEASSGKTLQRILIEDILSMLNPAWSPDGNQIAFSGVKNSGSDLYVYDLKGKKFHQLTNDQYSDLQPGWSPDGKQLAFITDRFSGTDFTNYTFGNYEIALFDIQDSSVKKISLFAEVNHINPQFGNDSTLYFLAAPDGVSNIYRFNLKSNSIEQVTHEKTGVAGITDLSPALSIATKTGELAYTVFKETGYQIFKLRPENIKSELVSVSASLNNDAGKLPPVYRGENDEVAEYLHQENNPTVDDSTFLQKKYKSKIGLTDISNSGVGVGTGPFGTGVAGAVNIIFSDILEENIVYATVAASGSVQDIGGIIGYMNQKKRYLWGAQIAHIPYAYASYTGYYALDTIDGIQTVVYRFDQYILREFNDQLQLFAAYPLTRVNRFETSGGINLVNYSYRLIRDNYFTDQFLNILNFAYEERMKLNDLAPDGFVYGNTSLALVGDDSRFGFTSPLDGYRYRIEFGTIFGSFNFETVLADFRYYKYVKPVSFAVRGMHYGRYLGDADGSRLSPLTIAMDYLVRGYNYYSLDVNEFTPDSFGNYPQIDRLFGSKLGIVNLEVRLPITGPREIAPIKSLALPSTLNLFFDGGVAWTKDETPRFIWETDSHERIPVFSAGLSLRVNVLGYLIAEGYYAIPFQRPAHNSLGDGVFGILLYPGW